MIMMYSYRFGDDAVGKARLEDADASYKDLAEVCSNIRGRSTAAALSLLEKAAEGEMPILYRKYISGLAHRKELCGRPGRYPKKAAKLVLGTLRSAIASAKAKGLSEDLVVVHAAANKKDVFPRLAPKGGKRSRSYYETARVEIVVREKVPTKKAGKKPEAKKEEPKVVAPAQAKMETARKVETKPAALKTEAKPAPAAQKAEAKPAPKAETKPAQQAAQKIETAPAPKPESKAQKTEPKKTNEKAAKGEA